MKYIISYTGIEILSEGFNGFYSWDKIYRVEKRKKGILIFPQPKIANWIPIKAISPEEIIFFKNIIEEKHIMYKVKK